MGPPVLSCDVRSGFEVVEHGQVEQSGLCWMPDCSTTALRLTVKRRVSPRPDDIWEMGCVWVGGTDALVSVLRAAILRSRLETAVLIHWTDPKGEAIGRVE